MKRITSILVICCVVMTVEAQTTVVNKPLKDFPDTYDLSTPLNAGVTMSYLLVNGTENLWRDASTFMNINRHRRGTIPDRVVSEESKDRQLNRIIKEVIVYRDSVACMITQITSAYHSIRYLGFEDGKWLNIGEDLGNELENSREVFYAKAPRILSTLRQSNKVRTISVDTLAFVNYVKHHGVNPKDYLLEAFGNHLLVIYGELHRRKVSWDLLTSVLYDPRFIENIGIIFVELPSYQQEEFDRFYASKELDKDIILEIMRSEQPFGWFDRGEYEFLINIWKLNQTLPADKQIKVVATDEQLPYKFLKTAEDFKKSEANLSDRNTNMANMVEQIIKTKTDKRNSLFIVGYGHAYKSHVPGGSSAAQGHEPALTAGAQLVQRLSDKNVFVILQHVPMGTNTSTLGFVRQGLFDVVFEETGNKPIAFHLAGSPFGTEPFDVDFDKCFDSRAGNFTDNFDGYIFLQPLKEEESDYILYDIWSDQFVEEMKRRATLVNFNMNRWIGTEDEITRERIITTLKGYYEGKKRWAELFE